MPIAASASARPANRPSNCARNRGRETVSANTSSIVRSLTIGNVGSIDCTIRWMSAASDSSGSDDRITTFMLRGANVVPRGLISQEVDLGPGLLVDAALLDVPHDADDGEPRRSVG